LQLAALHADAVGNSVFDVSEENEISTINVDWSGDSHDSSRLPEETYH